MFPALFISLLLPAAPTTNQLQTAQTHLLQEQWEDAASILDELATKDNPTAEIMYDRGIAHYNLNQFGVAAEAFEDAMVRSENQALQTHSAFNYGNAVFQKTMQELEGTGTATSSDEAIGAIDKAKEQIKQALQSYRRAISEDASDMDARANGEFAWQMLTQLDQMQEQMEEQQKQQEQQEQKDQEQSQDEKSADEQEKDQQNKEQGDSEQEQQEESEQSEQQDGEQSDQQQDGKQGEQSEQDKQPKQDGEQSDQQQDGKQGEQSEQDKQPKQDGEQSDQQQDGKQGESSEQDKQSKQDGEQSDQKEQDETQQDISEGELETEQEPTRETEVPQANKKEDGKRLSKDEAARLLQRIRDKEQQRRKALAAKRAQRRVPVDKDW